MSINPHAIVHSLAKIGANVEIGAFCVIESDVVIGDGCRLDSNVTIKQGVVIGKENHLCTGTIIGGRPQHTAIKCDCGGICIGNNNVFRENVTIHRAIKESDRTTIGDNNYLMVNAHVAHDCKVGNDNVLVNNVMLAGHVQVGNRVNLGGAVGVHQFCRIGSLAMVGGLARVIQDVPPFVTVDGLTGRICGLNQIGLRRSGRTVEEIRILKEVYRLVFRSGLTWKEILKKLEEDYSIGPGAEMTQFLAATKRGIVSERHSVFRTPLRLLDAENDDKNENDNDNENEIRTIRVNAG
ncbi:MAG: acyl-ACP--UDP-N-acetylglucosamine O-acyltransferase [Planctomycetaceae bacterium]|jgi:UDP-N-acetylglucosamine acyltransferase|nr:acyl-ACP--UDP-N-acetylglucosamine O-acyltransferase [Planctomycetaceae bacterium]